MVSKDAARLGILRRAKFPSKPPIIRYRDVRATVTAFLSDFRRDVQRLTQAEDLFSQRASDNSLSSLRQDDARQSIEVLHAVQAMANVLNPYRFSAAPREQPSLVIAGVEVSVRLDLLAHGSTRGMDTVGGVILRLTQADTETNVAKDKRREMGLVAASLARMHMERNNLTEGQVANRLCMAIDIRQGEVFSAPASSARRMADIEIACQFISAAWPSIAR